MTMQPRDIVKRLEWWTNIKPGDILQKDFMPATGDRIVTGEWIDFLRTDLRDAIATIKHYRALAGAVSLGQSFRDIAENVPRRSTEPPDPQ